jgi:hypothetical protein
MDMEVKKHRVIDKVSLSRQRSKSTYMGIVLENEHKRERREHK